MSAEERLPAIPKPKTRARSSRKLLLFLFLFFIVLLVILFFRSSLNEVTEVEIAGYELVTMDEIGQAAGVKTGDHFFSVSSSRVEEQVKQLPMIEEVQVSKQFPGKIRIEVAEYPKVAYQIGEDGRLEALLADASAIPITVQSGTVPDMPLLTGWSDQEKKLALCQALSGVDRALLSDVSEIVPYPSEAYPSRIKLYTRSQFEVHTLIEYLPEKVKVLNAYVATLIDQDIRGGVLKLLEADSHIPLEALEEELLLSGQLDQEQVETGTSDPDNPDQNPDQIPDQNPDQNSGETQEPPAREGTADSD